MDTRQAQSVIAESVNLLLQRLENLTIIIDRTLAYPVNQPQLIAQQNSLINQKQRLLKIQEIYIGIRNNLPRVDAQSTQETKLKSLIQNHTIELDEITHDTRELLTSLKQERANNSTLSSIVNELDIKWKQLQTELKNSQEEILDHAGECKSDSFAFRRLNNLYAAFATLSDAMSREVNVSKSLLSYYQTQSHTLHCDLNEEFKLETLESALMELENAQGLLDDKNIDDTILIFQLYLEGLSDPNRKKSIKIAPEDYDLMIGEYKKAYQKVITKVSEISQTKKHDSSIGSKRLMGLFDPPSARTKLEPDAPLVRSKRDPRSTQKR